MNVNRFMRSVCNKGADVCVLAGDIGDPFSNVYDMFMRHVSSLFELVVVIPGNHEFYSKYHTMDQTRQFMERYFRKHDNVKFLDNDVYDYKGYRFVGTILWSHVTDERHKINDVYKIPNFNCAAYNAQHAECTRFLENALKHEGDMVVITHHVPSYTLIDAKFKTAEMDKYNQWFYSDMEHLAIAHAPKIKCWIYGHTHIPHKQTLHGTQFAANPIGYPGENPHIDLGAIIEI